MMWTIDEIKHLIAENEVDEALRRLDLMLEEQESDELYFLRGNAHSKHSDWKHAMGDYCKALELNPDSPAADAYNAVVRILDFYNKDMYNP